MKSFGLLQFSFSQFVTRNATRLQYVQNALARFVTGASKYTHITSTLRTLHWLPIRQCIIFKTLVLVYKYLTTGQPKYFAPYLPLYKSAMNTRCSNPKNLFLQVPSYCASIHKSKVHFNNSFSYDAPKLWNDLQNVSRGIGKAYVESLNSRSVLPPEPPLMGQTGVIK